MTQQLLDEHSISFWDDRIAKKDEVWLKIENDVNLQLEIDDWSVYTLDTKKGKTKAIKTVHGKLFSVEAKYVTKLLLDNDLFNRHVKFDFIRHYDEKNPGATFGNIDNVEFLD